MDSRFRGNDGREGRRVLVPELDLVTVRILDEGEGLVPSEIAALLHIAASGFDRRQRRVDRPGTGQPETEMDRSAGSSGALRIHLEGEHVIRTGPEHLRRLQIA